MESDSDLLEYIRLDDEKAFTKLFYRYSSGIYRKAYSYLKDEEACEQIVHDIFLTLWNNRKTQQISSLKGYLTAAARYRVYKSISADKAAPIDYKADIELFSKGSVENKGLDNLTSKDLHSELHSYLENLPKRCREIFLMSRMQVLSNEEIAGKLGISKRSVENQITYALKYLRLSLKHISVLLIFISGVFGR